MISRELLLPIYFSKNNLITTIFFQVCASLSNFNQKKSHRINQKFIKLLSLFHEILLNVTICVKNNDLTTFWNY